MLKLTHTDISIPIKSNILSPLPIPIVLPNKFIDNNRIFELFKENRIPVIPKKTISKQP
jgi:hypothetical protein